MPNDDLKPLQPVQNLIINTHSIDQFEESLSERLAACDAEVKNYDLGKKYRIVQYHDMANIECKFLLFFWKTIIQDIPIDQAEYFQRELEKGRSKNEVLAERKFSEFVAFVKENSQKTYKHYVSVTSRLLSEIEELKLSRNELYTEKEQLVSRVKKLEEELESLREKFRREVNQEPIGSLEV